jgi:hypothetical protein
MSVEVVDKVTLIEYFCLPGILSERFFSLMNVVENG